MNDAGFTMTRRALGVIAYGAVFAVGLPLLLALWMQRLDRIIRLPAFGNTMTGALVMAAGLGLVGLAMYWLWREGGGLAMSPFPPGHLVTSGPYAILPHPIYVGSVTACLGYALLTRSAAGLWVVTPLLALSAASFVMGYEREATSVRFGALPHPFVRLPPDEQTRPGFRDRVSVYALVLIPWAIAYEAFSRVGLAPDARSSYLGWDALLPVVPWAEAVYILTYPYVALAPLLASNNRDLRRFAIRGLWATAAIGLFYLLVPFSASPKPVPEGSIWTPLLLFERWWDEHTSLPSFHVVWACLVSSLLASRWPRAKGWLAAWTAAVGVSCVATGMHAVMDIVAGLAAAVLVMRGNVVWAVLCRLAEVVANSWREWRVGPFRALSHGVYAALGGAVGVGVATWAAGRDQMWWIVALTFGAQAGAGLWAQIIEGSPQLLRPYGYFGSVFGAIIVSLVAAASGRDPWLLLAATAVGACFTQPFGRLRCLVQGCCHGRPLDAPWGIRYTHPRSRVTRLSKLGGLPLHPAPLYSILWMLTTGAILCRLWVLGVPLSFIAGGYLVFVGLGRFVEEHYRGEPQTAIIAGLRLYQWLAIAFVTGGSAVMAIGGRQAPPPEALEPRAWGAMAVVLFVTYALFGIDVPGSNRRFSRLV
jgi:protein-S-isoprenylcysteine O-methyltransferase Ste14